MIEAYPVVIDTGVSTIKAGMAYGGGLGDINHLKEVPTVFGQLKAERIPYGSYRSFYFGHDAVKLHQSLDLQYVYDLKTGELNDSWNLHYLERIWSQIYDKELRVETSQHPVLLTEASWNLKDKIEKMMEIFFDIFSVPSFYYSNPGVLAVLAGGRSTGMVLQAGAGSAYCVPVYEGHAISHAISKIYLTADDLDEYLTDLVTNQTSANFFQFLDPFYRAEIKKNIKAQFCYVAGDFSYETEQLSRSHSSTEFTMPDGKILDLQLKDSVIKCPEALFKPFFLGKGFGGIHQTSYQCIQKCDVDLRRTLFGNIILSGGTTMFPGLANRLSKEVSAMAPSTVRVEVIAPTEKFSVWMGGSVLSTLATFQTMRITRQEFNEIGYGIVHRKCI